MKDLRLIKRLQKLQLLIIKSGYDGSLDLDGCNQFGWFFHKGSDILHSETLFRHESMSDKAIKVDVLELIVKHELKMMKNNFLKKILYALRIKKQTKNK